MYVNSRSCSVIGIKLLQGPLEFDFLFNKGTIFVVVKSFLFCSQYGKLCEKCRYVFSSVKYYGFCWQQQIVAWIAIQGIQGFANWSNFCSDFVQNISGGYTVRIE